MSPSSLGNVDLALLNPSCRILTVSSSVYQAASLIARIRSLGGKSGNSAIAPAQAESQESRSNEPVNIPWTITNRYYTADVHFAAHPIHGLSPHQLHDIPAVIFVWAQGEEYRQHVLRLAQDLEGRRAEVLLAVKIKAENQTPETNEVEDDIEVDGFLSSHGFEYVDASLGGPFDETREGVGDIRYDDIPRLPRIRDALSTIMWPSMQTNRKTTDGARVGGHLNSLIQLDWERLSQDPIMASLDELTAKEMDGNGKWLPSKGFEDDLWQFTQGSGTVVSPTGTEPFPPRVAIGDGNTQLEDPAGFDDNFTVFISAPAAEDQSFVSVPSSPSPSFSSLNGLLPSHAGELYSSLGSVSDLGDMEHTNSNVSPANDIPESHSDDEDSDDLLPTREEIAQTSARIFGGASADKPLFPDELAGDDDNTEDFGAFDLPKILNGLQQMKAEIACLEDADERRKAAARVALGLVYGLENGD